MNEAEIHRRLEAALAREQAVAETPILEEIINRYLRRPAKLMRPRLLLRSAEAYASLSAEGSVEDEGLRQLAAATELLHVFALMHDDQVDGGARPGVILPSESGVEAFLLLAGDLLHTVAEGMIRDAVDTFRLDPGITRWVRQVSIRTIAGQALDVSLLRRENLPGYDDLYRLYDLKTGYYSFVAPLIIGSLAVGFGEADAQALEEIGLNLGRAYQLRDDLEDTRRILAGKAPPPRPWELNLLTTLLSQTGDEAMAFRIMKGESSRSPKQEEIETILSREIPGRIDACIARAGEQVTRLSLPSEEQLLLNREIRDIAGL